MKSTVERVKSAGSVCTVRALALCRWLGDDLFMGLISLPTAVLSDADIADALSRAVRVINPVLTVLAQSDPFGLKERTYELGAGEGVVDKALDALACALNTATTPGTKAWDKLDTRGRLIGGCSASALSTPYSWPSQGFSARSRLGCRCRTYSVSPTRPSCWSPSPVS